MRLLFLCSKNKLRSPTAELVFSEYSEIETDSAGLNRDAEVRLSDEQILWSDLIFVMEKAHRSKLTRDYSHALKDKRVIVLGIPDRYRFMSKDLIALLKKKCAPFLP
jgi:predicted protein tyrosine phosphatase